MAYIQNSQIREKRSWFRLSIFSDIFWGIINFIVLFFTTLIQPNKYVTGATETDYRQGPGRGFRPDDDSGFPRRRMGGFRRANGPAPPPMGGG